MFVRNCLCALLALVALALVAGCSDVEPKHGTRVTFAYVSGGPKSQERLQRLSQYLLARSQTVLGVDRARVESVSDKGLVLLLPGKKIKPEVAAKIIEHTSLEFYTLANVATKEHPERTWRIRFPRQMGEEYLFIGPDAQRLDGVNEPRKLMEKVVGVPPNKPLLTGDDVLPDATSHTAGSGYGVKVHFKPGAAKRLAEFTRNNPGEYLAFFYNGYLMSVGVINEPIEGGEALLTGFRTLSTADTAVMLFNSGTLPIPLRIESVIYY